ncbi:hypothetical protein QR680_001364 [Steinernema hermaphroditum]|uniref:Sodium-coupled monocarboxylate transporter 1 n=1 Tax=Steinernema hermaphroditum TaxID=289476 RepID=A0AA39GZI3_9BILA|nr:hypothetical protein QR680_001364 [Steinernema hermaphroditum]
MTARSFSLGVADFVVFVAFLSISISVGIYYAVIGKFRKSKVNLARDAPSKTDEYLMGGRKMPIIPVALSLLTTFLSGITLLGTPAEVFERGVLWLFYYWTCVLAFAISIYFFIPIFFDLQATSIYEYLELRYHSVLLRRLCAATFILNTFFYMGAVVYAPSVALSGVTGISTWVLIILVGVSSTIYTTLGGLKAVVWTDTLQAGVMYGGIGLVIVKGTIDAGGFGKIWDTMEIGGRFSNALRFDPDPAQYQSFFTTVLGGVTFWMSLYGLNQMAVQRYCCLPSLNAARVVAGITIPLFLLLATMACFIGAIVLTYFYNCNPIETGEIATPDQLVILFAVRVLGSIPGLPGLFLACMFATTLSTVSTGYNSIAAVAYEDFIKPYTLDKISPSAALRINKALVCGSGAFCTGMAFLAGPLGGIIKSSISLMGTLAGPIMGLFFIGVFYRSGSSRAVVISFCSSIVLGSALWVWSFLENPYADYYLPTDTTEEGCGHGNFTLRPSEKGFDPHYGRPDAFYLTRLSPYIIPFIGLAITVIMSVGLSQTMPAGKEQYSSNRRKSLTFLGRPAKPFTDRPSSNILTLHIK